MKKKLFLIVLAVIIKVNCFSQLQQKYSAQAVKEDFEYLYKTLEASHYNLYVNTEQEVFDKEYKRISESIKDSLTPMQINRLFQTFTALSQQEHCNIGLPIISYVAYLQNAGKLFPLNVFFKNNQLFVLDNYSTDTSIIPSDEIISINGKPIKDVMKGIYNYLSAENEYLKNSYIEGVYFFPRIYWMVYGSCDTFLIGIRNSKEINVNVQVNAISGGEFEGKVALKKTAINVNREFRFIEDIAYLHPGKFLNAEYKGNLEHKAYETDEFCHFIDSSFAKILEKKTKSLIIDLRGNPGGNNTFSDYMVAYFADKPFRFSSKFLVKTSQITKNFWADVKDSSLQSLRQDILSYKNGGYFEAEMYINRPRTDSLSYSGKVYVLINRYTYSNAPSTAAMIQDYKFGVIMGETTADMPTCYGAAHEFKLPNTQLLVMYPKAFIIRPNGDKSLHGVIPDYKIEDNILTEKDEILDYTIDLIKKEY